MTSLYIANSIKINFKTQCYYDTLNYFTIKVNNLNPIAIKLELLDKNREIAIFDGNKIICKEQIDSAIMRANRARDGGKMIANIWGIEVLLQLAGTHQINLAINLLDITKSTQNIIFVGEKLVLKDGIEVSKGLPEFNVTDELIQLYKLSLTDYCKEVIAKGVLFSTDYE